MIFKDEPAIYGPSHLTFKPLCLECLLPVDGSFLCPECDLPLCSTNCVGGINHQPECKIFSQPLKTGFKFRVNFNRPKYVIDCTPQSGKCRNSLSHFFLKNFVKAMVLLKKLLNTYHTVWKSRVKRDHVEIFPSNHIAKNS